MRVHSKMSVLALEHKNTGKSKVVFTDFTKILLMHTAFWLLSHWIIIAHGNNKSGRCVWLWQFTVVSRSQLLLSPNLFLSISLSRPFLFLPFSFSFSFTYSFIHLFRICMQCVPPWCQPRARLLWRGTPRPLSLFLVCP